ncbi:NAD(P)/FAD-dependent oxidoreductase [Piscinibacter sakaiensis]|uniref:NAD(P)/FAD-dependent oxidoreductase n=1 Tax=Piscinibacter sakaiensis TaxID=1547922 RepID=UPI003AAAB05E
MNQATSPDQNIVVVGGGHAAAALCAALANAGQGHRVHLVCAEAVLPYQRPPLSKTFLKNADEQSQPHRADTWYAEAGIRVHQADPAESIDRAGKTVTLRSATALPYEQLVLATGTRARRLAALPDGLANVALLRSAEDAAALRSQLTAGRRLTVLGGGFIGLEVAMTALGLGLEVEVLEAAPRLLSRSISPELADFVRSHHQAAGLRLQLGAKVDDYRIEANHLVQITVDGEPRPVDLMLVGIGAEPETALAEAAGLEVDNGVLVNARMMTSDPAIYAVGDCARFPQAASGQRLRLESVQNATDQARCAAANLLGNEQDYTALPWFWSEQGPLRLQMAGLMPTEGRRFRRPGAKDDSFSILHYRGDELVCVESVNAPMDHMMSRKLLEAGKNPPPEQACDPAVPLKSLL